MADEKKIAEELKKLEAQKKATIDQMALEAKWLDLQGKKTASIQKQVEMFEQYVEQQTSGLKRISDLSESQKADYLKSFQSMSEATKGMITDIDDLNEKQKQISGTFKTGKKVGDDMFGSLASKLGMASDAGQTFSGKLKKLQTIMSDKKALTGFVQSFKEIFTVGNVIGSVISKVAEMTFALAFAVDEATAAFAAQTGAGRALTDDIMKGAAAYRHMGITAADLGKASVALFSNYPGFLGLSQDLRMEMEGMVAGLEKVGVSMDESAKTILNLEKSLGFAKEESAAMIREIGLSGVAVGKTLKDTLKDFSAANKVLSVYGQRAPKIFSNIQSQAQAAGVEVSDLLNLTKKFDTFSSAAETAAKMNAVFGTSLSGVNMLMLEEDQRIDRLRQSFQAMGRDFDELGRFEKKAAADILGFGNDTEKAGKVLKMSAVEFEKWKNVSEAADKSQKAFQEKLQAAMPILLKLKTALMELAITLTPLTEKMNDFATWVLNSAHYVRNNLGKSILGLIFGVGILTGAFIIFTALMIKATFAVATFGGGLGDLAGALTTIAGMSAPASTGIVAVGGASAKAGTSMVPLIFAVGAAAAGFGILMFGMAELVQVMGAVPAPMETIKNTLIALGGAVVIFGCALFLAGKIGETAAPGIILLTLAVLGMGVGIGIAAAGIGFLVSQLVAFQAVGMDAALAFVVMAAGVSMMALAMAGLANPVSAAGLGLFIVLLGVVALVAASVANLTENLTKLSGAGIAGVFTELGKGLTQIDAKLQGDRGIVLQSTIENLALVSTGQSSNTIAGKAATSTEQISKAIENLKMKTEVNVTIDKAALDDIMKKGYHRFANDN